MSLHLADAPGLAAQALAIRLMAVARMIEPKRYDSSEWRSAVARICMVRKLVSETWNVMAGLGPPLAAARVVGWAEASWLSGMTRAAMATARAGRMMRGLTCRVARAMFTVISISGEMPGVRSLARRGVNGQVPCPDCAAGDGPGVSDP